MFKLIRVELRDGAVCRMAPKALNLFLAQGRVVKFERSDGWAIVGSTRLRDMKNHRSYSGLEQRFYS